MVRYRSTHVELMGDGIAVPDQVNRSRLSYDFLSGDGRDKSIMTRILLIMREIVYVNNAWRRKSINGNSGGKSQKRI